MKAAIKVLGNAIFTAKVAYMGVDRAANSNGKFVVVFKEIKGADKFNRDHFNAFPEDWMNGVFERFIAIDRTGKTYKFSGEVYEYPRKDGSKGVAIRKLKAA
jgi:hypothetical protein